uniref:EF-hand domain-containing protein n=1 Tax=Myripristis murdjan TaxID=586833 RepID=A0A667X9H6_9TELE
MIDYVFSRKARAGCASITTQIHSFTMCRLPNQPGQDGNLLVVFFLFRLYDYDRSGHMDGLEMMKLLSDYNSHNAPGAQANEPVRKSGCGCVC